MTADPEHLIDSIYEAAVLPELWPAVLEQASSLTGAFGGNLFTQNWRFTGWTATQSMVQPMTEIIESSWAARNPRIARALAKRHPGFICDHDLFTPEEMDRDPFYAYARGMGLGWVAGTSIEASCGDIAMFSWERRFADGPFTRSHIERLDALRPHFARAALLSGRFALERARVATEALALIGLPAGVLSSSGRLIVGNGALGDLTPHAVQDRSPRLVLSDARADPLLGEALSQLAASSGDAVRSIPVRAQDRSPALIVHLVPVRGGARDIFSSAACVLIVTPVSPQAAPSAEIIHGLFDLTVAEARVAKGVAEARTLDDIATAAGVAIGTVRQQLKSVFAKTGVTRRTGRLACRAGVRRSTVVASVSQSHPATNRMSRSAAQAPRSLRRSAAAIMSGNMSGVQANTGTPMAAIVLAASAS